MPRQLTADVAQLQDRVEQLERFIADTFGTVEADVIPVPLDDVPTEAETTNVAEADDLDKLSRDELDERAAAAGIDSPEELPNKGAVRDAIRQARR